MLELILIGVCAVLFFYLFHDDGRKRTVRELIDRIPGPKTYPLIGSVLEFTRIPRTEKFRSSEPFRQKYGSVFRSWWGSKPVVHILNPENAEIIFNSRQNINKSYFYQFLEPWLGTGLLTSGGVKWHKRRKLLTPAFHFSILGTFFPVFVENADVLVKNIESKLNEEFDVFPFINKCTLEIICETAMGVKLTAESGEKSEYISSVKKVTEIVLQKATNPWLWIGMLYAMSDAKKQEVKAMKILHQMSIGVIQQKKQQRKDNQDRADGEVEHTEKKAFLDMLLDISKESNVEMSDEDIREEVDTFMFEGHDTTSSAISSAIHFLGSYPDVQERVAEELYSVFGDSDRQPTMSDISQLKYLSCVIKETLRLCPPVPLIGRTLSEDVQLKDYLVPSGTEVSISVVGLHRDPNHYPNADKFDPDNFSTENCTKRHPFAFVPFSAGPRNCIGQKFAMLEEKVILSSLLRKYQIVSQQSLEELVLVPDLVLRPMNGIKVKISRRTWGHSDGIGVAKK